MPTEKESEKIKEIWNNKVKDVNLSKIRKVQSNNEDVEDERIMLSKKDVTTRKGRNKGSKN